MSEVILNGLLIESSAYRNISFEVGSINKIEYDSNYSIIKVTYKNGTTNDKIRIPGSKVINKEKLSIEGTYQIDYYPIIINGIKFHELRHGVDITQVIVSGDITTQAFDKDLELNLVINEDDINMSKDKYIKLINKSSLVYAESTTYDFLITNYTSVNFEHRGMKYRFNNTHPYSNDVIYTDEVIIINGLLDFLEKEYPQYRFKNRPVKQNDEDEIEVDDKAPNEYIYYNTFLGGENHNWGTRPLMQEVYDTYRGAVIDVQFEYTTDDLNSMMKFREDFIMQREFSNKRNYKFNDSAGDTWDASVWWTTESGNDVKQDPSMYPETQRLDLNSFRFKAEVMGIICRSRVIPNTIAESILSIITSNQTRTWTIEDDE